MPTVNIGKVGRDRTATTINSASTYVIPSAGDHAPGSLVLSFINDATFSGSVTIKARPAGTSATFVAIPYTALYLNGAVSAMTIGSTAITTTSLIRVEKVEGLDVAFDVTSYVSGSGSLSVQPTRS